MGGDPQKDRPILIQAASGGHRVCGKFPFLGGTIMAVVGKQFTFLLIVVEGEIPTQLLKFCILPPFQRQSGF